MIKIPDIKGHARDHMMAIRISLRQREELKALARKRDVSSTQLVREGIEMVLAGKGYNYRAAAVGRLKDEPVPPPVKMIPRVGVREITHAELEHERFMGGIPYSWDD